MRDYQKTKVQLIQEVDMLRARLADQTMTGKARPPRVDFDASIDIDSDFDVVDAKGINLSKQGLCFELSEPLSFTIRLAFETETHNRHAQLVLLKQFPDRKYRFGLKFVD